MKEQKLLTRDEFREKCLERDNHKWISKKIEVNKLKTN